MSVHVQTQARFSTYLEGHRVDPRARQRLIVAAIASTVTVAVAGAFGWTADKLGIEPVDAPKAYQAIMLEVGPPPPPPAPPPEQPSGGAAASDDTPPDDAPVVRTPQRSQPSDDSADTDDAAVDLDAPPAGRNVGVPGPSSVPGPGVGKGPGFVHGIGDPCLTCTRKPPGAKDDDRRDPVTKPVSVVKANAIFTPDPDQKALGRTKTGLMRPPGKSTTKVSFCVTTKGAVSDVRTVKKYPGDPEVDRICRAAVAKWRFRPLLVGGRAHKTCTTTTFVIEFE